MATLGLALVVFHSLLFFYDSNSLLKKALLGEAMFLDQALLVHASRIYHRLDNPCAVRWIFFTPLPILRHS